VFRNRPVSLALVGLFVWVTACASYTQIEPAEVADYDEVRVTFSDGEQLVLKDVTVEGDSIYYWQKADESTQYSAVRVSSPLDQVVETEVRGGGAGGTVLMVGVIVVGAFLVTGLIVCSTGACSPL
jgi:hypothetical protein